MNSRSVAIEPPGRRRRPGASSVARATSGLPKVAACSDTVLTRSPSPVSAFAMRRFRCSPCAGFGVRHGPKSAFWGIPKNSTSWTRIGGGHLRRHPGGRRIAAATSTARSATRSGRLSCSNLTVARAAAVRATILASTSWNASLQRLRRGWNRGTSSPVAGSMDPMSLPLCRLHAAHANARLSSVVVPPCFSATTWSTSCAKSAVASGARQYSHALPARSCTSLRRAAGMYVTAL